MGLGEIGFEREDSGVAVITVTGEHDLSSAPALRERLAATIEEDAAIVVDLSGAAFIDSSILGAVLDARHQAHEKGLGFAVALYNGSAPVERVLEVTGLTTTLPVHPSRAAAITAAQAGPRAE